MEYRLWQAIVAVLSDLDNPRTPARFDFTDRDVVAVYYWAVIHDRPTTWALDRRHWPPHLRRRRRPSDGTMSRRLRSASVVALLDALEKRVVAPTEPGPFPAFADRLREDRTEIERRFGNLTNWGGGLACLPAWVRTHRRVRRWVQAKLVLTRLKPTVDIGTCAA